MKVAVFSTKPYDKKYFEEYNQDSQHQLEFFETSLYSQTTKLTDDLMLSFPLLMTP